MGKAQYHAGGAAALPVAQARLSHRRPGAGARAATGPLSLSGRLSPRLPPVRISVSSSSETTNQAQSQLRSSFLLITCQWPGITGTSDAGTPPSPSRPGRCAAAASPTGRPSRRLVTGRRRSRGTEFKPESVARTVNGPKTAPGTELTGGCPGRAEAAAAVTGTAGCAASLDLNHVHVKLPPVPAGRPGPRRRRRGSRARGSFNLNIGHFCYRDRDWQIIIKLPETKHHRTRTRSLSHWHSAAGRVSGYRHGSRGPGPGRGVGGLGVTYRY